MSSTPSSTGDPGHRTPPPLSVAASLAGVEGVVLALYGVAELVATSRDRLVMGLTSGLVFVGFGAVLVVCAWSLQRVRSWARGPVLLTQLIQLGLAWNFWQSDTIALTVVLAVAAAIVVAGLLHPASLRALEES